MKKSEALKWCEALESGKFKQTQGQLRKKETNSFCCLGVACHLKAPAAWDRPNSVMKSEGEVVPESIANTYGLRTPMGDFDDVPYDILEKHGIEDSESWVQARSLAELNDDLGWNFKRISAFIRDAYKWL